MPIGIQTMVINLEILLCVNLIVCVKNKSKICYVLIVIIFFYDLVLSMKKTNFFLLNCTIIVQASNN